MDLVEPRQTCNTLTRAVCVILMQYRRCHKKLAEIPAEARLPILEKGVFHTNFSTTASEFLNCLGNLNMNFSWRSFLILSIRFVVPGTTRKVGAPWRRATPFDGATVLVLGTASIMLLHRGAVYTSFRSLPSTTG